MRSLFLAATFAVCTTAAAPAFAGGPPPSSLTLSVFEPVHIAYRPPEIVTVANQPDVVAAVPEPSTWAMMLTGFGLVGWALRRHMRSQQLATA